MENATLNQIANYVANASMFYDEENDSMGEVSFDTTMVAIERKSPGVITRLPIMNHFKPGLKLLIIFTYW